MEQIRLNKNKTQILNRMKALAKEFNELTIELECTLKNYSKPKVNKPYTFTYLGKQEEYVNNLFELAFKQYGVFKDALIEDRRKRNIVSVRHVVIYIMYYKIDLSLKAIGVILNRDHSTVQYSKDKIHDLISLKDETITEIYDNLKDYK